MYEKWYRSGITGTEGLKTDTGSQTTEASFYLHIHGDCSHEIKRCLLLGRKVMTNLDSILKSRQYFANKGPSSQGCGFSSSHVWM